MKKSVEDKYQLDNAMFSWLPVFNRGEEERIKGEE